LILLPAAAPTAHAGQWYDKVTPGVFGLKGGMIGRGTSRGHFPDASPPQTLSLETKIGKSGQVFFDIPLLARVYLSATFDFHDLKTQDEHQWMLVSGLGLKPTIRLRNRAIEVKPCLSIGWGHVAQRFWQDPTDYMTITLGAELHAEIDKRQDLLVELALIRAQSGGNDELNATLGPMLIVRAGLAFR
jgi:hypothetical protein